MENTDIKKFRSRTADAVRVLAFFRAKLGKEKELEKILRTLVTPTRNEPGNIAYVLNRSTKNLNEFLFDEIFVSMKAFEEHTQKPYIKSLMPKINNLVDGIVTVETYYEV